MTKSSRTCLLKNSSRAQIVKYFVIGRFGELQIPPKI